MLQKAKDDNQFDIAEALKTRKPLRKTTKAKLMVDVGSESSGKDASALLKKSRKINATSEGESKSYILHETIHTLEFLQPGSPLLCGWLRESGSVDLDELDCLLLCSEWYW